MKSSTKHWLLVTINIAILLILTYPRLAAQAQETVSVPLLVGVVRDGQSVAIAEAVVTLQNGRL